MRTSATRLEQLTSSFERGHSEIGNLDVLLLVEEEILRFQISMTDVETVAVVDSGNDLLEIMESFVGVQLATFDEVVEEFPSFDVLHDEVPVCGSRRSALGEPCRNG